MPAITNSFTSYSAVGVREDLANIIHNIDPYDTPFQSAIGRTKATQTLHEWQTDTLDPTSTNNAQLEAFEFAGQSLNPTTRARNVCQISAKQIVVSGTMRAARLAGRDDELDYQIAKAGKALKKDIEYTLLGPQGLNTGSASVARVCRGLESWLTTNDNRAGDGAAAATETAAPTDGTQRAFTEAMLKDVILQVYNSGGNPKMVMVGGFNKQVASTFTGRASARENVSEKKILGAASLYASDFGDLRIVPNRHQRARTAFVIDPEYAKVAYLRNLSTVDIAKDGDADKAMIVAEYTLEVCNERAHGVIADLTTS